MSGELKRNDPVRWEGRTMYVGEVKLIAPNGHVTLRDMPNERGGGVYTTLIKAFEMRQAYQVWLEETLDKFHRLLSTEERQAIELHFEDKRRST